MSYHCHTVDASEIPNNHLECMSNLVNDGINLPFLNWLKAGFLNHQQYFPSSGVSAVGHRASPWPGGQLAAGFVRFFLSEGEER